MLVRDIIDIDSTYEDFEALEEDDELKINKKSKIKKDKEKNDNDEKKMKIIMMMMNLMFLLQKWKRKLNQKFLNILDSLNKNYCKTSKISNRKT